MKHTFPFDTILFGLRQQSREPVKITSRIFGFQLIKALKKTIIILYEKGVKC